jgi:hypothetical protein
VSYVTDVVLVAPIIFDDDTEENNLAVAAVAKLNDCIRKGSHGGELRRVDGPPLPPYWYVSTGKVLQASVWVGAINYLDEDTLREVWAALDWGEPDVALVVHGEDTFRVFLAGQAEPVVEMRV